MLKKEKIHERKPNRLKEYDYSNTGWYYVTICTRNHIPYFGRIKNGEMHKNVLGKIAEKYWLEIPEHFHETKLDEYVIMPNHIHGIIIIDYANVGTRHALSLQPAKHKLGNIVGSFNNDVGDAKFASPTDRTKMTLSKIIQQYKRAVTIKIKTSFPKSKFRWQRSFYDRIIRNEKELFYIRRYIQQNPLKWEFEKNIDNLEM